MEDEEETLMEASHAGMPGAQLNPHGRYSHIEAHLRGAIAEAGLRLCSTSAAVLRYDTGLPVPGIIVTARKER